ncbi:radical SAM protein [bacterium]|nr:radical SAM protein [candidate division CSSED10-310 bacterium]
MDILFLQNIWFEFLGTMSLLSSIQEAGFAPGLSIGSTRKLMADVSRHRPRIVAFSCVTGIQGWALGLARSIKHDIDPGIRILMGGPHPTFFPEILREHPVLDYICLGEGEGAVIDLLRAGGDPEAVTAVENLHVRTGRQVYENPVRPLIPDLDTLPFMNRELPYQYKMLRGNPVKRMITGRGCPNACSFCFNHSAMKLYRGKGQYVRKRSVEHVLEEIDRLQHAYPVQTIRFEDDLFGVDRAWLLDFCEKYPGRFTIPFISSMRADAIDDEIARALKGAGCFNVVIGVESGDERIRNALLKKRITDDQLKRAAALLHENGINFCTTNILGLPGERFQDALKTVQFTLDMKPAFTWCSVFQPYPRTELGSYVIEKGLVDALNVDDIEPNYHSGSLLKQPDIHRCVNLHKFFYVVFNHPRLLLFIKPLTRLPTNPIFLLIHRISFLFIYTKRWNITLGRAVREALKTSGFTRKIDVESQEIL